MNLRRRFESIIHGWLPKERESLVFQGAVNHKTYSARKWFAVLVMSGTFAGALLGTLGYFLGLTTGIGLYVWSMSVGIAIGSCTALVYVRKKRKEEQQRS